MILRPTPPTQQLRGATRQACQAGLRACAAKPLGRKKLQQLRLDGGRAFPGGKAGCAASFPVSILEAHFWKRRGAGARPPAGMPHGRMQRTEPSPCSRVQKSATASAVTEMHGASLHRRHRFRGVSSDVLPRHSIRPGQAAALSHGIEYYAAPACRPACEGGAALKLVTALQDASRSRGRWASCRAPRQPRSCVPHVVTTGHAGGRSSPLWAQRLANHSQCCPTYMSGHVQPPTSCDLPGFHGC